MQNVECRTQKKYVKDHGLTKRRKQALFYVLHSTFHIPGEMMAVLAVHDREASDAVFERYLAIVEREACDDRNYVKKAVNWALRQTGKRNPSMREKATIVAGRIREQGNKSARWIASDALREFGKQEK